MRIHAAIWIAAVVSTVVTVRARADVTYLERTWVKEIGSPGGMEISKVVRISGQKEREESITRYSVPLTKKTGIRRLEATTILRPDKGLSWRVNSKAGTYDEASFDQLAQEIRTAAAASDSAAMTAESPDANPQVEIERTADANRIGDWIAKKTIVRVSTQVIDLKTRETRNGMIVWEVWLADSVPGAGEIRSFDQLRALKIGSVSEYPVLFALGESYSRSVQQAMLAMRHIDGFPVEWTWTLRTELSPAQKSSLSDAAATQHESADEQSDMDDKVSKGLTLDPAREGESRTVRSDADKDMLRPDESEGGEDLETVSADMGPGIEEGMMVLMKARSTLKRTDTGSIDPALFEIPDGYQRVGSRR